MTEFQIEGRVFRNKQGYEAGLRDHKKIERLKERIKELNQKEKEALLIRLKRDDFKFETPLGQDFIDDFEDSIHRNEKDTSKKKKRESFNPKFGKTKISSTVLKKEKKKKTLDEYDPQMQTFILKEMKRNERNRKIAMVLAGLIGVSCIGFFGLRLINDQKNEMLQDELSLQREDHSSSASINRTVTVHISEDEETEKTILPEYVEMYEKNENLIGWIKIDDTNIDYPVMKTSDRSYYLTHGFDEEYDRNGCIFMDPDCNVIRRSTNIILYGHHMHTGKMFGNLDKYKDFAYYQKHPLIQFDTIYEKGTYEVVFAFLSKVFYEDEITFKYYQFIDAVSEDAFYSNCEEMRKMSLYDTGASVSYGDQLLTLSTCDKTEEQGRFVVVARKID